jgi:hypothetical protein
MDWFGLFFFSLFILTLFFFVAFNVKLIIKVKNLNSEINKSIIEYMILADKYKEAAKESEKDKIEKTEGFLKFVSESREAAFEYIEDVQKSIQELRDFAKNLEGDVFYLSEQDLVKFKSLSARIISHLPKEEGGKS